MNVGERVKLLRKELGLSQSEFGEKIGKGKVAISHIESGNVGLTETNAKLICREFNVDYFWLTEGTGEMFRETPDSILNEVFDQYKLDDIDKKIVKKYVEMKPEHRKIFKEYLQSIVDEEKNKSE